MGCVYHFGLRASTVALTDENGSVTDRYQYAPYGELVGHEGTSDTPFLYNGRDGVMTDANGLYYMRARYYNPQVHYFLSKDTLLGNIVNGQSLNRYAYVKANPVSNVDPSGLKPLMGATAYEEELFRRQYEELQADNSIVISSQERYSLGPYSRRGATHAISPPHCRAFAESGVFEEVEPRPWGSAAWRGLGYSAEGWIGWGNAKGVGIGGRMFLVEGEETIAFDLLGQRELIITGTLGSLGANAGIQLGPNWRAKAGVHVGIGIQAELR
ncbi:RHS repeat-associated core domain-containing protein [Desulforudis sp. 1031]|uniref:RHS repeat-associated core domain-containing protein n=1 Tax=unclassified Candidatus Desulforudis TaxID=2635950 RepID=UPI003CE53119